MDRARDLELRVLDQLDDALRFLLLDADLDLDRPLDLVARDLLDRARLEVAWIDVALGEPPAQHVHHLAELELVVGEYIEVELLLLDARIRALEVVAVRDLLVGLLDRVFHFLLVDLRNDVERRHGFPSGNMMPWRSYRSKAVV